MNTTRLDSPTYYRYNTENEDLKIDLQVKHQKALVIYRPLVSGKWCLQKAQLELNVEILGETNYLATNKTTINCLKLIEDKVELRFYNNDSLIDLKKSLFLNWGTALF